MELIVVIDFIQNYYNFYSFYLEQMIYSLWNNKKKGGWFKNKKNVVLDIINNSYVCVIIKYYFS